MPTAFPTALDLFNNPTVGDNLDTPGVLHDEQHANANDAIEAIEARVGITNSVDPTSHSYKIAQHKHTGADGSSALVALNAQPTVEGTGLTIKNVAGTAYLTASSAVSSPALLVQPATSRVGVVVKGASGQTANLQEWQSSAGGLLARISSTGLLEALGGISLPVGSFGTPTTIAPDHVADPGVSALLARADHWHGIVAAAPDPITPDEVTAEGNATSFARSNHHHGIVTAAAVDLGVASAEGDAASFARSNHTHRADHVCTSGTRPASPYTGMHIQETDTGAEMVWDGSVWREIARYSAWTAYTPTHSNITVGNGTQNARYRQSGKLVHVRWSLSLGSTSAIGSDASVGLPFPAHASGVQVGAAWLIDAGTKHYAAVARVDPGQSQSLASLVSADNGGTGTVTATLPFTWVAGDALAVQMSYEAA